MPTPDTRTDLHKAAAENLRRLIDNVALGRATDLDCIDRTVELLAEAGADVARKDRERDDHVRRHTDPIEPPRFPTVLARALRWHDDRFGDPDARTAEDRYHAVAKPNEEAGELLGAWNKHRRAVIRLEATPAGEHRGPTRTHYTDAAKLHHAKALDEAADVIIATIGALYVLGLDDAIAILELLDRKLTELEARPTNDPTAAHA